MRRSESITLATSSCAKHDHLPRGSGQTYQAQDNHTEKEAFLLSLAGPSTETIDCTAASVPSARPCSCGSVYLEISPETQTFSSTLNPVCRHTPCVSCQRFSCLSRACLGKYSVFRRDRKRRKNERRFRTADPVLDHHNHKVIRETDEHDLRSQRLRKDGPFWSFPCVCPEPVLVK